MPSPLGTALRRILSTGISFSVVVGFTVEPCDCSTLCHKLPAVCQYEVGMIDRCHFNITSYSDMVRSRRTGWRMSVLPPDDKIHAHSLHHVILKTPLQVPYYVNWLLPGSLTEGLGSQSRQVNCNYFHSNVNRSGAIKILTVKVVLNLLLSLFESAYWRRQASLENWSDRNETINTITVEVAPLIWDY